MSRGARKASRTGFYHVTNRGVGGLPIFQGSHEKSCMLRLLKDEAGSYGVGVYAYCILPDHYHFLVKADLKELSSFIAVISAVYAQYYNYREERHGSVFHERFRSQCIEKESNFWNCVRYIHQHPVRAEGREPETNLYGSFREYSSGKRVLLCKEADAYLLYHFENREEFRRFHEKTGTDWFADVAEEEYSQKIEIARIQLKKMMQKYKISKEDVFGQARLRTGYEKELEQVLNIAAAEAKRIRQQLEREKNLSG